MDAAVNAHVRTRRSIVRHQPDSCQEDTSDGCSRGALWGNLPHPIGPNLVLRKMGFEQLAELRDRLRAQAEQSRPAKPESKSKPDSKPKSESKSKPKRAEGAKQRREPASPEVEAIWRLQKHFPRAFPRNPAPKVPLKQGILEDAQQHLEALGMTAEQLKQAIGAWCQGGRYWACLTENAERVDLQGQPAGQVTAAQAMYARKLASQRARQQSQERRAKRPRPVESPAPAEAAEADSSTAQSPS